MNKSDYYKDLRESFPLLVDDLTFDFDFEEDDERRNMFYNNRAWKNATSSASHMNRHRRF